MRTWRNWQTHQSPKLAPSKVTGSSPVVRTTLTTKDKSVGKGKKLDMQTKELIKKERDELIRQIEALKAKVSGLELALSLFDRQDSDIAPVQAMSAKSRSVGVKAFVIDLLKEVGTSGASAAVVVDTAERRNISVDRGTVSSLLSRLKRDGIAVYDGEKYRLKEFASLGEPQPATRKAEDESLIFLRRAAGTA